MDSSGGVGEGNRATNNTIEEVAENKKNEEKQVRVKIAGKADDYFDNVVLSPVRGVSGGTGRHTKFDVQSIHNTLKKTINTNTIQQSSASSPSPCLSDLVMILKPPRSKKRILVFCLVVLLIFILATSLPFIVEKLKTGSQPVTFMPLQNVYHQIYGREGQDIG